MVYGLKCDHRHKRRINTILLEQLGRAGRCIIENYLDLAVILAV